MPLVTISGMTALTEVVVSAKSMRAFQPQSPFESQITL
ncbi:hypothetical protein ACPOL_3398 [Acidisarcina polymorpha]|uniref:Uncharacterized protein n=1 Tax=Acidisarcina polymorpha TaxID=2211140 RepID=A0A2Z5G209_9BACT|nr:hypothetical protein ACPOL_3398 [Acidisarcina polymorpha]